jgi:hypothetical protein
VPILSVDTEERWLAKKTKLRPLKTQNVEMEDSPEPKAPKPCRFALDVLEGVRIDSVQEKVLNTTITLPLREVLAISTDLQKQFAVLTKTRRESVLDAVVNEGTHALYDEDDGNVLQPENAMSTYTSFDDVAFLSDRYAGAV